MMVCRKFYVNTITFILLVVNLILVSSKGMIGALQKNDSPLICFYKYDHLLLAKIKLEGFWDVLYYRELFNNNMRNIQCFAHSKVML